VLATLFTAILEYLLATGIYFIALYLPLLLLSYCWRRWNAEVWVGALFALFRPSAAAAVVVSQKGEQGPLAGKNGSNIVVPLPH
jgi:hypothetical protein